MENGIKEIKVILTENEENTPLNIKFNVEYLSEKNKNFQKSIIYFDNNSNNLVVSNLQNNLIIISINPLEIISFLDESSMESSDTFSLKTKFKLSEEIIQNKTIIKLITFPLKKTKKLNYFFCCDCKYKKTINSRLIIKYYFLINKKEKETLLNTLNIISLPKVNDLQCKNRKRKLLVFINPIGGKGNAEKIWEKAYNILSLVSSISLEIIYTKYFKHAYEFTLKMSPNEYDGIITCSGDGILHEVINAIYHRKDTQILLNKLTFSSLPAGSGNAFSKSISYYCGEKDNLIENHCYYIIKGITKKIDLLEYELRDLDKKVYSFLTLTWSFIADVDLESEFLRCLGMFRVTLMGVIRWISLRKYYGTLYYLNDNNDNNLDNFPSIKENIDINKYNNIIKESDQYNLFVVNNLKWVSENQMPNAKAELDDGYTDILSLKNSDSGKYKLLKELLIYFDDGTLLFDENNKLIDGIHYIKTKFWRLIPKTNINDPDDVTIKYNFNTLFSIDGERYPICPVQCKVLNKIISAYSGKE